MNGLGKRFEFYEAAAGTSDGVAFLTDAEIFSRIVAKPGYDNIPEAMAGFLNSGGRGGAPAASRERLSIRVVDIFAALGQHPIDLLKIDLEGEEHRLLGDPRFASLPVRNLVIEWHDTRDRPYGRAYALERLAVAGHRIISDTAERLGSNRLSHGVLW